MATIKKQLTLTFKQPNIAESYGPYASVFEAHTKLSEDQLNVIGMTVGIQTSNTTIEEYWYQGGTTEQHLVKKQTASVEVDSEPKEGSPKPVSSGGVYTALQGKAPSTNIQKQALASDVRSSLDNADTALQSFTETDPTVPAWAKAETKPSYTASEVGALPASTSIPSKTSDLTNDSGFLTQHLDISGKENTSNKVTSLSASSTDTLYPSAKCVYDLVEQTLDNKQDTLISGSNIKTINNNSILGSGNISIPKGDPLTYADLTTAQKEELAQDATAAAQQAAAHLATIQSALNGLDPSQSTEDAIAALTMQLANMQEYVNKMPYAQAGAVGDLDLVDGSGNVLVRFQNGHIKTKNFDSSNNISDTTIENKIYSIFGNNCEKIVASSVSNGTILSSSNYPYHLKKGMVMSFYMDLYTFDSITIGKGNNKYKGQYFTIDSTNIVQKSYESNVTVKETQPHGLTISNFLKVILYNGDEGDCNVILQSKEGYYQHSFNWGYEANYAAFVLSTNTTGTNAVLNLGNSDFKKPIWFFGDSYFGIAKTRWPGCLKSMGYFDYLLDGAAGQNSIDAYTDLERCLNFGKPKTLVWCLGMNDTDSNWSNIVKNVKTLCSTNNIELILATIPTVPTRSKETISSSVRNSKYRYIDFYKAVGANSSGSWYTGYLESGISLPVHPTELGAQALATQVLIDFPEIMQQKKLL